MAETEGKLFDRRLYARRRNRAAGNWGQHDFLHAEAEERLAECLKDIKRRFPLALYLGSRGRGVLQRLKGRGGVETLIACDLAENFAPDIVCDEEHLPFAEGSFDLVMSCLNLHHVNDLVGALIQVRRALKPDGLLLAILPGASTLRELRSAVVGASAEHGFALSPRIAPFVEIRDAGALLMRAGFALPVVDSDIFTVEYEDAFRLMRDLRGMGESNVLESRCRALTSRGQLAAIAEHYRTHFAKEDGSLPASFEFITLTGWRPHASQQQPARRGSAQVSLKQVL